jgi:hypothetical protein
MCVLPPGDYNLNSGCHGDSICQFFVSGLPPTGDAGKNTETGFYSVFFELPQ